MTQLDLLAAPVAVAARPRPVHPVKAEIDRLSANAQRVLELLQDGQWHTNMELVAVGGIRAVGRCWDLQQHGHVIVKEYVQGGSWRYKLKIVS